MATRLTDDKKAQIMADYHVGMSQNAISIKHDVSKGLVNKLCKDVEPLNKELVNTLTRANIQLAGQNDRNVTAVHKAVTERMRDMEFFRMASIKIANKALEKVDCGDPTMFDLEKAQNIIGKGKENIYGKVPDTAVQVNNNSTQTTYKWESDE